MHDSNIKSVIKVKRKIRIRFFEKWLKNERTIGFLSENLPMNFCLETLIWKYRVMIVCRFRLLYKMQLDLFESNIFYFGCLNLFCVNIFTCFSHKNNFHFTNIEIYFSCESLHSNYASMRHKFQCGKNILLAYERSLQLLVSLNPWIKTFLMDCCKCSYLLHIFPPHNLLNLRTDHYSFYT